MQVLRQQVKVLERQVKRVLWQPRERLLLALLRERLPRSAWATLLIQPETVLGWHRELVRRRWAAYCGRPRAGRRPLVKQCRELIQRTARENPELGLPPDPRRAAEAGPDRLGHRDPISAAEIADPAG